MTDVATLDLDVNSSKLKTAERAQESFARSAETTERRVNRATDRINGAFAGLASAAGALAGSLAAAISAGAALRAAENYTRLTNSLRAMGLSAEQAASRLDAINEIAGRTRAPLDATAQLYTRISVAAGELGASQQDILQFTENVGLALGAAGIGANEASGALLQLSQAMAGGTVRAEEFNSIIEGAYPLALAAARGIEAAGGSVGRLRLLINQGKVSSQEFFNAILSQSDQLQTSFDNTSATIGQAMTRLVDNLGIAIGKMDQTLGVTSAMASGILLLSENIDRLAAYAAAAGVVLAAAYAPAIIAASLAMGKLTLGLIATRAALIRTGFGALVVLIGELTYQILQLSERMGGFGNLMRAVGDLASEVWGRIGIALAAAGARIAAAWNDIKATAFNAMDGAIQAVVNFGNSAAGVFTGSYEAMKAIWGNLPSAIGDFAYQAANGLIGGVEAMLNGVVTRINGFISGLNNALSLLPEWATGDGGIRIGELSQVELGRVSNPFAGSAAQAGTAAAEAFNTAMAQTYISPPDTGLGQMAADAEFAAGAYREAAGILADATTRPLQSLEAFSGAAADAADAADGVGKASEKASGPLGALGDAAGKAGGGAKKATDDLTALQEQMQQPLISAIDGVSNAFGDFVARGFKDFGSFVKSIPQMFLRMLGDMAAAAMRNKIMISLGIGGGGAAGTMASAATGGAGGIGSIASIVGGIGKFAGGIGTGLSGVLSGGGIMSGISGGLATGGAAGMGAALGAALPVLGPLAIVGGLFSRRRRRRRAAAAAAAAAEQARLAEEQASAQEAAGIQGQIDQLTLTSVELRQRELAALRPANRALAERLYQLQDEKRIAEERSNLETRLLQLQGNTAELRRRELETLDVSNRSIMQQIYALEDQAEATEAARRAAEEFANSSLFVTAQDRQYAATAFGNMRQMPQQLSPEERELMVELIRSVQEGNINNARLLTDIKRIDERRDLEPVV